MAFTNYIGGILLVVYGFQQSHCVDQPEGTITVMRLLFFGCPLVAFAIGLLLLKRYPLTQRRMQEVRTDLEKRRAPV